MLDPAAPACCWRGGRSGAQGIARLPDRGARLNQFLVDRTLPAVGAADVGAGGFALDATNEVLREMAVATPLADLARIEAPVWLVNGAFDHFRGEERRFLAACRDGRLVVVPRATHLVSLVQPARFTRVLLEALDEVEARSAVAAGRDRVRAWAPPAATRSCGTDGRPVVSAS